MEKDNVVIIDKDDSGQRFDKYLLKKFNKAGKNFVHKMLRKKRIKLNGKKALGNEILVEGDKIAFYISPETQEGLYEEKQIVPTFKINILYEDENLLVCDKPKNCLTHPDLINAAAWHIHEGRKEVKFFPAAVNRLDRNTSGIVLIAKKLHAAQELSRVMKMRTMEKYYVAIAAGKINDKISLSGTYTKDTSKNMASISESGEKRIFTEVEPVYANSRYSVLKIRLITGKSHQIRVHLQSISHPLIGDPKYGDRLINSYYPEIKTQLLHAYKIVFCGLEGDLSYLNGKEIFSEPGEEFDRFLTDLTNKLR